MKCNLFLLILCAISFSSCKKDNTTNSSREQYLTAHQWKYSIIGEDANADNQVDFNLLPIVTCRQDDVLQFNTNKTLVITDGANVCSASDPQISAGNWALLNSESVLQIGTTSYTIISLDANNGTAWTMNGSQRIIIGITKL